MFTTHYLDEADALAERVIIIDHGRVIADDSPVRLKAELAGDRLTLTTTDEATAVHAAQIARRLPRGHEGDTEGTAVRVRASEGDALLPELLRVLQDTGVTVRTADIRRPTLDDVFFALTGRRLCEDTVGATDAPDTPDAL